jgi:hypothetical protein
MLKDATDLWIIEPHFQSRSRDNDIRIRVDADILRTRSANANATSRREDMADVLYESPVLTEFEAFAGVWKSGSP